MNASVPATVRCVVGSMGINANGDSIVISGGMLLVLLEKTRIFARDACGEISDTLSYVMLLPSGEIVQISWWIRSIMREDEAFLNRFEVLDC